MIHNMVRKKEQASDQLQNKPVSEVLQGVPTQIIDGSTFSFKDKTGNIYSVKILGIEAPGVKTSRGLAAFNYLYLTIFPANVGQNITCFIDFDNLYDKDDYLIAVVCKGHLTDFSTCSFNLAFDMLEKGLVDLSLPSRHKYMDKKEYKSAYMKKETILKVRSSPSDAEIFIDGTSQNLFTSETIRGLTEGSHKITVKKTGYLTPQEKSITLKKDKPYEVIFELKPATAKLKVYSSPSHASLTYKLKSAATFIDPVRLTPDLLVLDPGTYIIKVQDIETSLTASREISLSAGDDKEIYIVIYAT